MLRMTFLLLANALFISTVGAAEIETEQTSSVDQVILMPLELQLITPPDGEEVFRPLVAPFVMQVEADIDRILTARGLSTSDGLANAELTFRQKAGSVVLTPSMVLAISMDLREKKEAKAGKALGKLVKGAVLGTKEMEGPISLSGELKWRVVEPLSGELLAATTVALPQAETLVTIKINDQSGMVTWSSNGVSGAGLYSEDITAGLGDALARSREKMATLLEMELDAANIATWIEDANTLKP